MKRKESSSPHTACSSSDSSLSLLIPPRAAAPSALKLVRQTHPPHMAPQPAASSSRSNEPDSLTSLESRSSSTRTGSAPGGGSLFSLVLSEAEADTARSSSGTRYWLWAAMLVSGLSETASSSSGTRCFPSSHILSRFRAFVSAFDATVFNRAPGLRSMATRGLFRLHSTHPKICAFRIRPALLPSALGAIRGSGSRLSMGPPARAPLLFGTPSRPLSPGHTRLLGHRPGETRFRTVRW